MAIPLVSETFAVIEMTLRGIAGRTGQALASVLGITVVVAVMIAFLSMAEGFERTVAGAGSTDLAVIMRTSAGAELNSVIGLSQIKIIADAPGVARDENGLPMISPELYVITDGIKRATGLSVNIPLRGMEPVGITIKKNLEIVAGRAFEPGRNELMVGVAANREFAGLELGQSVRLGPSEWEVVGIFSTGGSVFESEIWADAKLVQDVFRRGSSYQIMRVKLDGETGLEELNAFLEADPRLNSLSAKTEARYYAQQSEPLSNMIKYLGYPLAITMALGALAGALNSMYSSVAARTREIATIRALGFGGFSTFIATLLESVILSVIGGFLGVITAFLFFDGMGAATLGTSFTQVVFALHVSPGLVMNGLILAVTVGLAGGFFPALRAARLPILEGMRDN